MADEQNPNRDPADEPAESDAPISDEALAAEAESARMESMPAPAASTYDDSGDGGDDDEREAARRQRDREEGIRIIGLEKYTPAVFFAGAVALYWVLDKLITSVWARVGDPKAGIVTTVSLIGAALIALYLYRRDDSRGWVTDVAAELSKCTWPSREETSSATVVVIVTSIVAAITLGLFDTIWTALMAQIF